MAISAEFQQRFKELLNEDDEKNKVNLAKKIGVSFQVFSKAYNYGIIPKPSVLARIADYFCVSLEYLLGQTDNDDFEMSQNRSTFNKRLNLLLIENNINMNELSNLTHIHRNNISQWQRRNYTPTIDDLYIVADVFKVSIDYLLGRTDY